MCRNSEDKIENFIKECNKGVIAAREQISKMDYDEIIEMKAKMNGKIVTYDKWEILMAFVGLAVSVLGITCSNAINNGTLDVSYWLVIVILGISYVILLRVFWEKFKKGEALTALSYIDELKQECNTNKIQEERLDTYVEISKRQEEERAQLRKKWSEKQKFAQKQVELLDESLQKVK